MEATIHKVWVFYSNLRFSSIGKPLIISFITDNLASLWRGFPVGLVFGLVWFSFFLGGGVGFCFCFCFCFVLFCFVVVFLGGGGVTIYSRKCFGVVVVVCLFCFQK